MGLGDWLFRDWEENCIDNTFLSLLVRRASQSQAWGEEPLSLVTAEGPVDFQAGKEAEDDLAQEGNGAGPGGEMGPWHLPASWGGCSLNWGVEYSGNGGASSVPLRSPLLEGGDEDQWKEGLVPPSIQW